MVMPASKVSYTYLQHRYNLSHLLVKPTFMMGLTIIPYHRLTYLLDRFNPSSTWV
ncbi:hypothetical protein CLV25_10653 [Acetobacteroides hydrogenigenes]|uniref:Uncharacterized protein n=1 Tax=Acetobacteroides hydrogenigenes TaxID=979970 RepID=A0A4R2EJ04_9BACT|nr:hypothetical protein CLV25_10653 [Acetobacteroides hydrogenigenes]